jgi:small GTP-binding protein
MEPLAKRNFKIVLLGEAKVGKTALFQRLISNAFPLEHATTVHAECGLKFVSSVHRLTLEAWDLPSDVDILSTLRSSYMRNVDGVVVVADATDLSTLQHISKWTTDVRAKAKTAYRKNLPVMLLVNKRDHDDADATLTPADVASTAMSNGMSSGFYVSAARDDGVDPAFQDFTTRMVKHSHAHRLNGVEDVKPRHADLEYKKLNREHAVKATSVNDGIAWPSKRPAEHLKPVDAAAAAAAAENDITLNSGTGGKRDEYDDLIDREPTTESEGEEESSEEDEEESDEEDEEEEDEEETADAEAEVDDDDGTYCTRSLTHTAKVALHRTQVAPEPRCYYPFTQFSNTAHRNALPRLAIFLAITVSITLINHASHHCFLLPLH